MKTQETIQRAQVFRSFSKAAPHFRKHFDGRIQDPHSTNSDRFIWDLFDVPGQYLHLRTPLIGAFPEKWYAPILAELGTFGRTRLGCQHISEPWVSAYTSGHFQNLHSDPAHGPFAFVLGLTPKNAKFIGGETHVASEALITPAAHSISLQDQAREQSHFFESYRLAVGDLLVFDSSLPHFVSQVSGARGLLDGRLVIHGWFTEPNAMIDLGNASAKASSKWIQSIDRSAQLVSECLDSLQCTRGYISLRFAISRTGVLRSVTTLACTARINTGELIQPGSLQKQILKSFHGIDAGSLGFPASKNGATFTLPFECRS